MKFDEFINDVNVTSSDKEHEHKEKLAEQKRTQDVSTIIQSVKDMGEKVTNSIDNKSNLVEVKNFPTTISTPDIEKVILELKDLKDKFLGKTEPEDIKTHELLNNLISAVSSIKVDIPEQKDFPAEISINNFKDYEQSLQNIIEAVRAIKLDFKPVIDVKPTDVKIEQDFKTLEKKLDLVIGAVKAISIVIPETDDSAVLKGLDGVKKAINSLMFPAPNYVLPYKSVDGSAIQVQLNGTGELPIDTTTIETKQDSQITKMTELLTELAKKTEATQNQQVELINAIRVLVQVIANPSYVDKSANQMRAQVTGSLTTVTNLTNLTNFGSFPADHLQRMDNMTAWATNNRSLIA